MVIIIGCAYRNVDRRAGFELIFWKELFLNVSVVFSDFNGIWRGIMKGSKDEGFLLV